MTNRPIKFRAWDTEYKEWVTDTLLFYPLSGNVFNTKRRYLGEKTDKNVIIMQFTGLKDKNGKEIYELDRMTKRYGVLAHGTIYECVFHNGAFGYYPVGRSVAEHFTPFANSVNWHSFEVVGNAYEGDI